MNEQELVQVCYKECPFFYRFASHVEVCKIRKDEDLSEPWCYSGVYLGDSCRFNLTKSKIEKIAESRVKSQ